MDLLQEEMFARGLRSGNGGKIYKSKIDRILRNPFYVGIIHVLSTGFTGPGIHEPLISTHLFEKVTAQREGRAKIKKTRHNLVYRAIIACGKCGRNLIGERQCGHVYYRCHTKDCPEKTTREEVLDQGVQSALSGIELTEQAIEMLKERLIETPKTTASKSEPTAIKSAKIKAQQDRLLDAYLKGSVDEDSYKSKHAELQLAAQKCREDQQSAGQTRQNQQNVARLLEYLKTLATTYLLANASEKRQLLEMAFSNLSVADKTPLFTTKNWLQYANFLQVVPCGGPDENHDRSDQRSRIPASNDIMDVLNCPEAQDLLKLLDQIHNRLKSEELPKQSSADHYRNAA